MKTGRFPLLLLGGGWTAAPAAGRRADDFFVGVECDRAEVYEGKSCTVVYRLYSVLPFLRAEAPAVPKVKGARVESLPFRQVQSRVRRDGRVYFTVIGACFSVVAEQAGTYTLPSLRFDAVTRQDVPSSDPYDRFFGRSAGYKEVKRSAKGKALDVVVRKVPLKSTQEMLNSGRNVF